MIALRAAGTVKRTLGETVIAALPGARVGDAVRIEWAGGGCVAGDVATVERSRVSIVPHGSLLGIAVGDRVRVDPAAARGPFGFCALGRAFDGSGTAIDGGPAWQDDAAAPRADAVVPGERAPLSAPLWTGIRAIDGLLTIGRGARVGFFGAPGAGKTTLLETIVSGAQADAIVLALVGERGREAQRWCERLDRRTTIFCATSDRSAAERIRAAELAMAQANALRARGLHVLLVVDSLARYVAALRERRTALGEPVGRGGYPPGVWAELARFVERAGNCASASITLLATVLSDGGDEREPLSDAARSLLDGHVVLSSELAREGHYPAIDVLGSASRTMASVCDAAQVEDARRVRAALGRLARTSDARSLGLAPDADDGVRRAVAAEAAIVAFLRQSGSSSAIGTRAELRLLAARLDEAA